MSREIYTYTDLCKLNENDNFNKIRHYPIITVTSDLQKTFKGTIGYDKIEGMFGDDELVFATTFTHIAEAIDEKWNSDQAKFNRIVILSQFIRRKIESAKNDDNLKKWLVGCIRNLNSMLASITLLEQAKIAPEEFDNVNDRNIKIFVEAWKYLRENDETILGFQNKMEVLTTKNAWNDILCRAFGKTLSFPEYDAIVIHGFYYITPNQQRVFDLLENAGYKLIFFIPYDERYPFVYKIWDDTYSVKNGYPNKELWHIDRNYKNDSYGEMFEGKEKVSIDNKIQLKEYSSIMEFVNDVKKDKAEGWAVYSSDFKDANQVLKDYYPDFYGERKILSYPIGQFINVLNQMWDDELQSIILDEDNLIECFSSGWLSVDGVSGKQYMQSLTYIIPFFSGCKTIVQWRERIQLLKDIEENIINPFLVELDAEESVARWQEAVGNPLANFSMFAVESEKLDIILKLIEQLLDMARDLFGNEKVVRVSEHIQKLDSILGKYEISNEMYDEERKLVGDIFEKLGGPSDFSMMCAPTDIARALNLYIYGKYDDGEIQTEKVGMVYPLYFVDAACFKHNSKVHICMSDVNSMPGGNKSYVWPLTGKLMKKYQEENDNPLVKNLIQIMESSALCNRYFMYSSLKNKEVKISWIRERNGKLLAPSPYIKLVSETAGVDIQETKKNSITYKRVEEAIYGKGRIKQYDNDKTPRGLVKEAKMAYALCSSKYVLGYVIEKFPTYQSDFQQNYGLNALISAIYNLMKDTGITVDQVYKNVMSLFPSLRKVEKRQVYDYISYDRRENDMDYGVRTECGGLYYTDERIKIHYPNQVVRNATITRYGKLLTPDGKKGLDLYEVMEASNDDEMLGKKDIIREACIFCPHINYCRNAVYAGDQEAFYD